MANKRGNGSGSVSDIPFDGANVSDLERIIGHQEMPNVIKTFVNPGDTVRAMLMRTRFRDENERNAVLAYHQQLQEFDMEEEIAGLVDWLAGSVSVDGMARKEVLQGVTGFIVPGLYNRSGETRRKESREDQQ
jgi:hypothetical protein